MLLALTQDAADRYASELADDGLLVYDEDVVETPPSGRFRPVPVAFQRLAREKFDRPVVANIVACGVLARLCGHISPEGVRAATLSRVPRGTEEVNLSALELGLSVGRTIAGPENAS